VTNAGGNAVTNAACASASTADMRPTAAGARSAAGAGAATEGGAATSATAMGTRKRKARAVLARAIVPRFVDLRVANAEKEASQDHALQSAPRP